MGPVAYFLEGVDAKNRLDYAQSTPVSIKGARGVKAETLFVVFETLRF